MGWAARSSTWMPHTGSTAMRISFLGFEMHLLILLGVMSGRTNSMMFEILHSPFVRLSCSLRAESPEISPTASFGVLLARVQPVLARVEFSNHGNPQGSWNFGLLRQITALILSSPSGPDCKSLKEASHGDQGLRPASQPRMRARHRFDTDAEGRLLNTPRACALGSDRACPLLLRSTRWRTCTHPPFEAQSHTAAHS